MTGYGEAAREFDQKTYRIEIKSLNGKNADMRFKSNTSLKDKEMELRKLILGLGHRGKFEVNLTLSSGGEEDSKINRKMMDGYYEDLLQFAQDKGIDTGDILQTLVRLPNVVQLGDSEISEKEWTVISEMIHAGMDKLNAFRRQEGESLKADLKLHIKGIQAALEDVGQYEGDRIETVKTRIKKNINQHLAEENTDKNRFEQELLYYMEKLDINEEKVRLAQHCKFFLQELDKEVIQKGKKLNFVSQEIGREINTLGAKAQHSDIQQLVVRMKDELEKVKEQILNIL